MNDDHIQRLIRAAARRGAVAEPGGQRRYPGLATHVLARWRRGDVRENEQWLWERWARWGAALATVVAAVALVLARLEPAPGYLSDFVWSNPAAGSPD